MSEIDNLRLPLLRIPNSGFVRSSPLSKINCSLSPLFQRPVCPYLLGPSDRVYWINPGRYFVGANPARSALETIMASASQAANMVLRIPSRRSRLPRPDPCLGRWERLMKSQIPDSR